MAHAWQGKLENPATSQTGDESSRPYLRKQNPSLWNPDIPDAYKEAGQPVIIPGAIKFCGGRNIDKELFNKSGIIVRAKKRSTLAEEAPEAYKDVTEIVDVVHGANLSTKICRMRPLGVIKG